MKSAVKNFFGVGATAQEGLRLWYKASRQLAKRIWGVLGKGDPEQAAGALAWSMT